MLTSSIGLNAYPVKVYNIRERHANSVVVEFWLFSVNLTPTPLQPGALNNSKIFSAGEGSKRERGLRPSQNLSPFQTGNTSSVNTKTV
jgi:hypothetical protein